MLASKIARLPDAVLRDEWRGELGSPRRVVSEVEARVFSGGSLPANRANRFKTEAAELHKEADQLCFKGEYESALVLYHRAAKLYPRQAMHAVGTRRAEAAIQRAANPSRRLGRMLREARVPGQEAAVLDAEAAARRAREIVAEAQDPVQEIPRILRYLDAREDFWRISSPVTTPRALRSRPMRRQLNRRVRSTVKAVEAAHDSEAVRKLSEGLLSLVSLTDEPNRNQVDALAYLGTKQLALGRHDRAIDLAAKMLFRARTDNDITAMVKALEFIGKVHLSFGHLSALVRVWQRLVGDLSKEAVAQAWLHHDIGRCQFELGEYAKARESAALCIERAESVDCKKWMLRGHLLSGQSLLKLARLADAVDALKVTARMAAEQKESGQAAGDGNQSILLYVHGLIDQLTCLLRRLNQQRDKNKILRTDEDSDAPELPEIRAKVKLTRGEEHQIEQPAIAVAPAAAAAAAAASSQSQSQGEVAKLLARARELRATAPRDNGHPEVPPVDLSDVAEDAMDTSRTRVIRTAPNFDDEQTLTNDELAPLADFSVDDDIPSDDEENFITDGKPDFELTSRSLASSLDSSREPAAEPRKPSIHTGVLSDYLRSMESQEFLEREHQYIAGIKSSE
ncbi:outer dynein arm-docking complex subunit 4-like [Phymastichus coffea]|uniref:outer dynein arm-docking complex subunit 4-like n=1 Tax=Phymastichus coffea TaxID=108790 RepID=UPI00273CA0F4|nr:outer dynein arm-docking complex subunit 4-like [Phymastichus coffea]